MTSCALSTSPTDPLRRPVGARGPASDRGRHPEGTRPVGITTVPYRARWCELVHYPSAWPARVVKLWSCRPRCACSNRHRRQRYGQGHEHAGAGVGSPLRQGISAIGSMAQHGSVSTLRLPAQARSLVPLPLPTAPREDPRRWKRLYRTAHECLSFMEQGHSRHRSDLGTPS